MPFLVVVVFFTHLTIGVGTFGHFGKSGFGGAKGSRGMVNQCFNSTTSVCNVAKSVVCLNGAPVGWEVFMMCVVVVLIRRVCGGSLRTPKKTK